MPIDELIKELNAIVAENGHDLKVHVIFNGNIDEHPSINVDDCGIVYIEGVKE